MSTFRMANIGPLNGNTATVIDPGVSSGATFSPVVTTTIAATSGTSVLFTGIPSWIKKATFVFNNVTLSSASWGAMRIGSGGALQTSGYSGTISCIYSSASVQVTNTGAASYLDLFNSTGTGGFMGSVTVFNAGSNVYVITGVTSQPTQTRTNQISGQVTLSGALERFSFYDRFTGGTFTGGSITAIYE